MRPWNFLVKLGLRLHASILRPHESGTLHLAITRGLHSIPFSFESDDNTALLNLLVETSNHAFRRLLWVAYDSNSHRK